MLKMILKMNFNFNLLRIAFVTSPRQRGKSPLRVIAITKDGLDSVDRRFGDTRVIK